MSVTESKEARAQLQIRVMICAVLLVLPLGILGLRLWQVQVLQGAEHTRKAARQSIRTVRQNPVRGRFYGSDGELLVGNKCVYDLVFHPVEMRRDARKVRKKILDYVMESVERVGELLGRTDFIDRDAMLRHIRQRPAMPVTVIRNLDEAELCRIWELSPWIGGMDVQARHVRDYPHPTLLSHVLGFTGTIRQEDEFKGTVFERSYVLPDQIGRSGLELVYDSELSGKAGAKLVRVDPVGYAHEELSEQLPSVDGHDVILTIDSRAQRICDAALGEHRGAVVVMDIKTGGVLAMVSKPGFSLAELTAKSYAEMNRDNENKPLLNRAVNAKYTPGSIIKPLVGLAALESKTIDTEWRHNCIGYYKIGNQRIHCAKRIGHGEMDIYDAITVSCNPFFMAAGLATKLVHLEPMFRAAGLGQHTGIDIPEHVRGLCPSREAARQLYKRNWLIIDTAYCSMGQGLIQVTPLQMAVYCAAIANGGDVLRPHLVKEIRTTKGALIRRTAPVVRNSLPVSDYNMEVIQTAMANAVESDRGSGKLLNTLEIEDKKTGEKHRVYLAAKTGTAEVGTKENRRKETWMISFGPLPNPKYAFACIVEDGDSGSRTVAPIAFDFWKGWLTELEQEK